MKQAMVKGDLDGARIQFQEAVQKRPSLLPPRIALIELSQGKGHYKATLQYANAVLALLSSYVAGLPGWNQATVTSQLRTLLDASNPDNDFVLSDFNFPDIPIHIPAGEAWSTVLSGRWPCAARRRRSGWQRY